MKIYLVQMQFSLELFVKKKVCSINIVLLLLVFSMSLAAYLAHQTFQRTGGVSGEIT